jgi:hypothetical protein
MFEPIEVVVGAGGVNPAAGATEYTNTALAGLDAYIERQGFGTLSPSSYEVTASGGFKLLGGSTFGAGQVYFFHPIGVLPALGAGAFSNAFDVPQVLSALLPRLGFRQPIKPGYTGLVDVQNAASVSGRYFDDFHAAVTAPNLKDLQDTPGISNVQYNAWLQSVKRSVIMRALNAVYNTTTHLHVSPAYERKSSCGVEAKENEGKFVGYMVNISRDRNVRTTLQSATLYTDTACTLTVYIYKSGEQEPIYSQEVTTQAGVPTTVQFEPTTPALRYLADGYETPRYFVGYFQNELESQGAKAVNEDSVRFLAGRYFGLHAIKAPETPEGFDPDDISYTAEPYGLNIVAATCADYTDQITNQPWLFDELQGLTMAATCIEQIIYSTRKNGTERGLKDGMQLSGLMQDLNGVAPISDGPPPVVGLTKRIEREASRLKDALNPKPKRLTTATL